MDYIERKASWAEKMRSRRTGAEEARSTDRLPPGQRLTKEFPVLDLGIRPKLELADWKLELGGAVEEEVTLDWESFRALPQTESVSDFHCVTTWSKYDCRWKGVALPELIDLVRPKMEAKFVFYTGYDGYSTNTRIEDLLDKDVLIATEFDSKPLTLDHGGPARVIIPKLYAWKGSKFVKRIEFREEDELGFWEKRGYSNTADPWTNDRFL